MLRQEESHRSGDEEEHDDDIEIEWKADSDPGVGESELEEGGDWETDEEVLKDIKSQL